MYNITILLYFIIPIIITVKDQSQCVVKGSGTRKGQASVDESICIYSNKAIVLVPRLTSDATRRVSRKKSKSGAVVKQQWL